MGFLGRGDGCGDDGGCCWWIIIIVLVLFCCCGDGFGFGRDKC